jgi:hypothetical protein
MPSSPGNIPPAGGDLVRQGLADLQRGVESVPAVLVLIGGPRLRRLQIDVSIVNPPTTSRSTASISFSQRPTATPRTAATTRFCAAW